MREFDENYISKDYDHVLKEGTAVDVPEIWRLLKLIEANAEKDDEYSPDEPEMCVYYLCRHLLETTPLDPEDILKEFLRALEDDIEVRYKAPVWAESTKQFVCFIKTALSDFREQWRQRNMRNQALTVHWDTAEEIYTKEPIKYGTTDEDRRMQALGDQLKASLPEGLLLDGNPYRDAHSIIFKLGMHKFMIFHSTEVSVSERFFSLYKYSGLFSHIAKTALEQLGQVQKAVEDERMEALGEQLRVYLSELHPPHFSEELFLYGNPSVGEHGVTFNFSTKHGPHFIDADVTVPESVLQKEEQADMFGEAVRSAFEKLDEKAGRL